MNTIFGYWRCSTDAQDQERQIRALKDAGSERIVGDFITGTSNYGDRKEFGHKHTICTWQSLNVLLKNTKNQRADITIQEFLEDVV